MGAHYLRGVCIHHGFADGLVRAAGQRAGRSIGSGTGIWASGRVHPYYVMIALFVVLLLGGEVFYSPRVYEYAAAIAPKGQEASYAPSRMCPSCWPSC